MFLVKEILFCLPLIVYAGIRIRMQIPQRLFKTLFTLAYGLMVIAFPIAQRLSHAPANGWSNPIVTGGYVSLPLLLYLILAVLLLDLALCFARLTRLLSKETAAGKRSRQAWLFGVLLLPVCVVAVGAVRNNHPQIREYSIELPRKSSGLRQLKIAFASDFHFRETTDPKLMERFVGKVNGESPDLVLIGGDVLEGDRRGERLEEFEAQFRKLKPRYGVYGVYGNHDLHRADAASFFGRAGIRILNDRVERIGDAFYLAGRNDARARGRKPIEELLKDCDKGLPVIVLEHRPTDLENISRGGADILFSGHTHNGQLFPVNLVVKRYYELSWGHKVKQGTHVFVSSGIQVWGPPVRTAGASEILMVRVRFRDDL